MARCDGAACRDEGGRAYWRPRFEYSEGALERSEDSHARTTDEDFPSTTLG